MVTPRRNGCVTPAVRARRRERFTTRQPIVYVPSPHSMYGDSLRTTSSDRIVVPRGGVRARQRARARADRSRLVSGRGGHADSTAHTYNLVRHVSKRVGTFGGRRDSRL